MEQILVSSPRCGILERRTGILSLDKLQPSEDECFIAEISHLTQIEGRWQDSL